MGAMIFASLQKEKTKLKNVIKEVMYDFNLKFAFKSFSATKKAYVVFKCD